MTLPCCALLWNLDNLLFPRKFEEKCNEKRIERENRRKKITKIFKLNKLFLYVTSNPFHFF